jgi:hypothetical protein
MTPDFMMRKGAFQIARRFAHKKAREEIRAFPEFWKEVGQGYRRKLIERYPFGII